MFQNNFGGFYGSPYNNVWGQTPFVYNYGGNVPYNLGGNVPYNLGGNVPYNLGGNVPPNYNCNVGGQYGWGTMPFNYGTTMSAGNFGGFPTWNHNNTLGGNFGGFPTWNHNNTLGGNFGGFPTWNYNNTLGGNCGTQTFPGNQNFTPGFTNQSFGWPNYSGTGFNTVGCTTPNCL